MRSAWTLPCRAPPSSHLPTYPPPEVPWLKLKLPTGVAACGDCPVAVLIPQYAATKAIHSSCPFVWYRVPDCRPRLAQFVHPNLVGFGAVSVNNLLDTLKTGLTGVSTYRMVKRMTVMMLSITRVLMTS